MDLKLLRLFKTLASTGSFTSAAAALSMAQPILSRQIRKLEDEVGADLFYRNGRGVVLTEAGRLFELHASKVIGSMDDAIQGISALKETPSGEVVVGLPPTIGDVLTLPLVQAFRGSFPSVSLTVLEGFSPVVFEWLTSGRLDVALLYNAPPTSALASEEMEEERLLLFGPTRSGSVPDILQPGALLDGRMVSSLPLILSSRSRAHGLRALMQTEFSRYGVNLRVDCEVDSVPSIRALVVAGLGYTILPYAPMHEAVSAGEARYWHFADPVITRRLVLATSSKRALTPVTRNLATMVRQLVAKLRRDGRLSPVATQPP